MKGSTPLKALLNDLATRNVYQRLYELEDISLKRLLFANSHSLDMMRDFSSNKFCDGLHVQDISVGIII